MRELEVDGVDDDNGDEMGGGDSFEVGDIDIEDDIRLYIDRALFRLSVSLSDVLPGVLTV